MTIDEADQKLLENSTLTTLTKEPFRDIAVKMGLTQNEVVSRLKNLKQNGAIRRFGAKIKPRDIGLPANAVVAWKVPDSRVQEAGAFFSGFKEVTHCYERETVPGRWEYNLYTVMHSQKREQIEALTTRLSETIGVTEYLILFSKTNLKTSQRVETANSPKTGSTITS